jgi:Transglutaminase elicitor
MDLDEIQRALDQFRQNPRAAMARVPTKRDARGQILARGTTLFGREDIQGNRFVSSKDSVRRTFYSIVDGAVVSLDQVFSGRAPIAGNDRPENLVDTLRYVKPADMDAAGLSQAELAVTPWSDDYWATYLGILGRRYADPNFPASSDWKENFDYVQAHPYQQIAAGGGAAAIDRLSPSEKYDLLVGDPQGTLTAALWDEGRFYYERNDEVESWMGICHGWAPASYMLPRPSKRVTVTAADGRTQLRFYPSDIKSLASLLWANGGTPTRFIGSRSSDRDPATDEVGRVIASDVFDTNPGTWHVCVVNQIGVAKRSFIIDATYDYEVWNQPVTGYEYSYFNPQTLRPASSLAGATVTRAQFTNDRFKRYRSTNYATVVGVAMQTSYMVETSPSHRATDNPSRDAVSSADYEYDLELDAAGRIIGGEWYVNAHPDFLWSPRPGARVVTPGDRLATGVWIPTAPMPASWRAAAARMSASKLPLAKIVERLIQLANT